MSKIIKMIQDETNTDFDVAKNNDTCEHSPPGAAYPGDGSVHIDWVLAHHDECTAWMGDNVVNPDV